METDAFASILLNFDNMRLTDIKYKYDKSVVSTKVKGVNRRYNLVDPKERRLYFNAKVGDEIVKLREYLKKNSFIVYLLAPKMAGKGTYTKMLAEILGENLFAHVSVGDLVRAAHKNFEDDGKKSEIYQYAKENYRGFLTLDEAFDALLGRTTKKLLPTEFILTLIKHEIDKLDGKTIFLDGFPRKVDQVSYSLYFRDLINYRNDPDVFLLINIPIGVIDARIKMRRICPNCKTSRNLQLYVTSKIQFADSYKIGSISDSTGSFKNRGKSVDMNDVQLICDNSACDGYVMVSKEGDDKGIENIAGRIINDFELMGMARQMYGVKRIELYNAVKKVDVKDLVDDYELTEEYYYEESAGKLVVKTKPFSIREKIVKEGKVSEIEYISLLPPPVVVQLIRQLVQFLGL